MRAFIKSMDELAWKAILTDWTKKDESGSEVPKSELDWTVEENKQTSNNWKALNDIFNQVSPTQFKSISAIESAKESWDILKVEFKGTALVRKSRIELPIFKFKNLLINENETIGQYHVRISDISNESFILGENIPKGKLIRKVLRTLLERFAYKAAAIGEAKNLETMKLEELIGSLHIFEMELNEDKKIGKEW